MNKVLIILGSASDEEKMQPCISRLVRVPGVKFDVRVISAHRTPEMLAEAIEKTDASVIIAGAGMAAALPGAIAALTTIPVIGVPLSGSALNGTDALYAIAQMPPGIPVATVAIDGAKNAAILALQILATIPGNDAILANLINERDEMVQKIVKSDEELSERYSSKD